MEKQHVEKTRRRYNDSLCRQAIARQEKKKAFYVRLVAVEKEFIDASYLNQQYNSPRCWTTMEEALNIFNELTTKKDKLKFVKEQIFMRYRHITLSQRTNLFDFK